MLPKIQWFLRLIGFLTIGASMFMGENAGLVGGIGGLLFVLGFIKFKRRR
ncbi:hypothetical protein V6C27_08215 [Peptococcaceae bacterium 1198_IL3148]